MINVSDSLDAPRSGPTLSELERLVPAALKQYDLLHCTWLNLRYYENATYRVTAEGKHHALSIRSERYCSAELASELLWLEAMQKAPRLRVPTPIRTRTGELVGRAVALAPSLERNCTLVSWLEGAHVQERDWGTADFRRAGQASALLHIANAGFVPPSGFQRPFWDDRRWSVAEVLDVRRRILAYLQASFSSELVLRFSELSDRVLRLMHGLRANPHSHGLIHGDLHIGNFLCAGREIGFIDFEDLGWGYFEYDVATALFSSLGRLNYPELRDAFVRGYEEERPSARPLLPSILLFQVARLVFLTSLVVGDEDLAADCWWNGFVVQRLRRLLESPREATDLL
jgi:Ser/Thr protein kinase RdoA (MazF antagonist)